MMQIVKTVAEWLDFILNLQAFIGLVFGIAIYKAFSMQKMRHLKQVLSLNKRSNSCFISIPKFSGVVHRYGAQDVSLYHEVKLLLSVNSLLGRVEATIKTDVEGREVIGDEIQIGGPLANDFTNRHFNRYLKNIKWLDTKEGIEGYNADKNLKPLDYRFVELSRDNKRGFQIGERFYERTKEQDWGVVVKIVDKSDVPTKTIHLLFGAGVQGEIAAVDYFTHHYSNIYKHNKSKSYIGIFEVNGRGDRMGETTWLDIENYMRP